MNKTMSVSEMKRMAAFENRKVSPAKAVFECVIVIAAFVAAVILCAAM